MAVDDSDLPSLRESLRSNRPEDFLKILKMDREVRTPYLPDGLSVGVPEYREGRGLQHTTDAELNEALERYSNPSPLNESAALYHEVATPPIGPSPREQSFCLNGIFVHDYGSICEKGISEIKKGVAHEELVYTKIKLKNGDIEGLILEEPVVLDDHDLGEVKLWGATKGNAYAVYEIGCRFYTACLQYGHVPQSPKLKRPSNEEAFLLSLEMDEKLAERLWEEHCKAIRKYVSKSRESR